MSGVENGLSVAAMAGAFWNAFWVFIGIVAGALIQYLFSMLNVRAARKTAAQVLTTEIQMNLSEASRFRERLEYLKDRIAAHQIKSEDIYVSMAEFDYSALNPLVASGYFHSALGPEKAKAYLEFLRFFNNGSCDVVNSMLRTEHDRGKSIEYLNWLKNKSKELEGRLVYVTDHSKGPSA
ncbi:MAG: hypothetical protein H6896_12190 [Rhodovulum sp.]|nr:hypothetical protein [Paracoccaceae bacterium]MCC0067732.1 hypothetical protein [Rhodovulum sp.]